MAPADPGPVRSEDGEGLPEPRRRRKPRAVNEALEARNREIERLNLDEGWTYDQIGKKFDITRAAVHLVLKKRGSQDVIAVRGIRRANKADAAATKLTDFDATTGLMVRRLLKTGIGAEEIARRLTVLEGDVSETAVRSYADRNNIPVQVQSAPKFSAALLRLAVQAAAAETSGLRVEDADAALVDGEDLEALSTVVTGPLEVKALAARAVAARLSPEPLSVTKGDYETWRSRWLTEYPKPDQLPWPPTAQTVMKRLGGSFWNEAVRDAGLRTNDRGRTRGALVYKGPDEYEQAVAEFLMESEANNRAPSFVEYDHWAAGRPVPTGASIRNRYGGWNTAKIAAAEFSGAAAARPRGPRVLAADKLVDRFPRQLARAFADAADRIPSDGHPATIAIKLKESADELLGDLVAAFEGFRRSWVYEAIKEDPTQFLLNLAPAGNATKAERRAWAALIGVDARDAVELVITGKSLDGLLSATGGDLRNAAGWLATSQQSRLDRVDPVDSVRWRLMKAARNALEHNSVEAIELMRATMRELDAVEDAAIVVRNPPDSPANVRRWLAADVGLTVAPGDARISRSRVAYMYPLLTRSAQAMRSTVDVVEGAQR